MCLSCKLINSMPSSETVIHNSETYQRIARAIAFIRQHHLEQPSLATVAQHVNLSEYHFQRLRSEEHTSELQSPVPISYAVFCLKKKKNTTKS